MVSPTYSASEQTVVFASASPVRLSLRLVLSVPDLECHLPTHLQWQSSAPQPMALPKRSRAWVVSQPVASVDVGSAGSKVVGCLRQSSLSSFHRLTHLGSLGHLELAHSDPTAETGHRKVAAQRWDCTLRAVASAAADMVPGLLQAQVVFETCLERPCWAMKRKR